MDNNITEEIIDSQNVIINSYTNPEEDMDKIILELIEYIKINKLNTTGDLFARNYVNNEKTMVFEFGIPIAENIGGNEKIQFINIPKQKILSIKHKGSYDNINDSIKKLKSYLKENNLELKDLPRYIYYNSPEDTEENELITEIQFPIELL